MAIIHRPESFDEVRGHEKIIEYFKERINSNTLSSFYIMYGEEGLGKNTLANIIAMGIVCQSQIKPCGECPKCLEVKQKVIRENQDTTQIKRFVMSEDGSHTTALQVLDHLTLNFLEPGEKKVIFIDEVHRMEAKAQDALLNKFEFIPEGVIVIMTTTDILKLHPQLVSRAVEINLNRLSMSHMLSAMKAEVLRRNLKIQGNDATLRLIIGWAEFKPRKALKILEAMGENAEIRLETVKMLISFIDLGDVIPILSSLGASFVIGIETITKMSISPNTKSALVTLLTEAIKLAKRMPSSKFSHEDASLIKEAVANVDINMLVKFLYLIAGAERFNREVLLSAYLQVHPALSKVANSSHDDSRAEELSYMKLHKNTSMDVVTDLELGAPDVDDVMKQGSIILKDRVQGTAPTLDEIFTQNGGTDES